MEDMVSIVTPVYNAEKYLMDAVNSVRGQTCGEWELILVDDCSLDASREIMKGLEGGKVRCIYREENGGPAAARNDGVAAARGRYIAFLDADDLWMPAKLERQLDFMRRGGHAITCTSYAFAGEDATPNGKEFHVPVKAGHIDFLKSSTMASDTVMIDREKVPDELFRFPLGIAAEDAAAWLGVLRAGHVCYGLDEVLAVYRRHRDSRSGNKLRAVLAKWQICRQVEGMGVFRSAYYVAVNALASVRRRI